MLNHFTSRHPRGLRALIQFGLAVLFCEVALAENNKPDLFNATIVFSQGEAHEFDPQLLEFPVDMNLRAWQKWHNLATRAEHFPKDVIQKYHDNNIVLIAGGTASVIFEDETDRHTFRDWATVDAKGERVPHDYIVPGAYRASMANPHYRRYLTDLFKLQIDAGVDGLFIDEVNAGAYSGGQKWKFNGNEGFDKYFLADFNRYLLKKYPNFSRDDWIDTFKMHSDNYPRKSFDPADLENNFNFRRYLARHGWSETPLNSNNPLLKEWGLLVPNRTFPSENNFREQALLRYWKDIVDGLRGYAREKYQKEILITSNGIFPYVDFNSVGLYEYNFDDFNREGSYLSGKQAEYVPVKKGKLKGSTSLQPIFKKLYHYNQRVAGDVPLVLFIDWPTDMMRNYNGLGKLQREDYWRLYLADAYASGLRFAFHLKTSIPGDPSAKDKGMLTFFKEQAQHYAHYHSHCGRAKPLEIEAEVNHKNIDLSLVSHEEGQTACLHLVNHNYRNSTVKKQDVVVKFKFDKAISEAWLITQNKPLENPAKKTETNKIKLNVEQRGQQLLLTLKQLSHSEIIYLKTQ